MLDEQCRAAIKEHPDAAVSWFLCTSWLYYREDVSVISDALFDQLCKDLLARWAEVQHPHKRFISEDDLRAGSGFALPWHQLPSMVRWSANLMKKEAGV